MENVAVRIQFQDDGVGSCHQSCGRLTQAREITLPTGDLASIKDRDKNNVSCSINLNVIYYGKFPPPLVEFDVYIAHLTLLSIGTRCYSFFILCALLFRP